MNTQLFSRPYVISWNLTYRCNLACEHCYLDAGGRKKQKVHTEAFADRSELDTEECFKVIDQIAEFAPESVTILTGGEPLLRRDIVEIIRYGAEKGLWIVVGSNGVLITETLAEVLLKEGVRGMALSLDALDPERHDRFRLVQGAWQNTVDGAKVLADKGMPFIIQTTVGKHNAEELEAIAAYAYEELNAKVWNLYFLVSTGRGQFVTDLSGKEYEAVLSTLHTLQQKYYQKMIVNAKCAPHYITHLFKEDSESPFLKTFADGAGGCPAGTHYMGIRPNGDMTPCPYLPKFAGNLRTESFESVWNESQLFVDIRKRNSLGGKCGSCEFSSLCGGCRARAFGTHGDILAEDPLCEYEVGSFVKQAKKLKDSIQIQYGSAVEKGIVWDNDARARVERIPAFVRGKVIASVESKCRAQGIPRVTLEKLEELRAAMPTPKVFSAAMIERFKAMGKQ